MKKIRPPALDGLEYPDAAIELAEAGWRVGPLWPLRHDHCTCSRASHCPNPGGHPIDRPGYCPRGSLDFTTDTRVIARWWSRYPDAAIGMVPPVDAREALVLVRKDQPKGRLS
jgi:hypothetical protein